MFIRGLRFINKIKPTLYIHNKVYKYFYQTLAYNEINYIISHKNEDDQINVVEYPQDFSNQLLSPSLPPYCPLCQQFTLTPNCNEPSFNAICPMYKNNNNI